MLIFKIISVLILGLIAYFDIKTRLVFFWFYPMLFITLFAIGVEANTFELTITYFFINATISVVIVISAMLFVRVLNKMPYNEQLGIGDMLFIVCVCSKQYTYYGD